MIKIKPGEEVKILKRRHPFVLIIELIPIAIFFLIFVVAIIYFFFSSLFWPEALLNFHPALENFNLCYAAIFFLSLGLIFCWMIGFLITIHYYLDCWVITDRRTIHAELRGFFSRIYSSVYHDKIQDVTIDTQGLFATLLHYGDIHVQTAGGFREFACKQIPDPYHTKDTLLDAKKDYVKSLRG
jgi:uncharacterized membrane protein YdbT with pleckstrin-like domain